MIKALVLWPCVPQHVLLNPRGMLFFTQQLRAAASILPWLTSPPNFAAPTTTSLILPCDQKWRRDYSTSSYFCLPKLIRCGRVTENTPRDSCVSVSRLWAQVTANTALPLSASHKNTHFCILGRENGLHRTLRGTNCLIMLTLLSAMYLVVRTASAQVRRLSLTTEA